MKPPASPSRALARIVDLIALHSLAVGLTMLLAPQWVASFGGWGAIAPLFFARQAGAFHLVAAIGYAGERRVYGGVRLLLATKGVAFVFLTATWLGGETAWVVPLSALADGAMGAVVAWLRHASLSSTAREGAAPDVASS